MKKTLLFISLNLFLITLCSPVTPTFAQGQPAGAPNQIITLKDGSIVKGHLVGVNPQNGAYIIKSETLGEVSVPAEKVLSINAADIAPAANANNQNQPNSENIQSLPEFKSMQNTLLNDPALFSKLQDLAADPEMMQILQDKDFLNSLSSMDPAAIENNPKFQKLIHHPAMQALIEGMKQKVPPGSLSPNQP